MKYWIKTLLLYGGFMLGTNVLHAQDCRDIVRRALEMYEKGHLNEVRTILSDECIKLLSEYKEKEEAYYLLAVASLYMKDLDSARNSMLIILNENPEFVCKSRTPVGFQKYYETFRTNPVFVFGGRIGINGSQVKSTRSYSLDNADIGTQGTFKRNFAFQIHANATLPIFKRIDLVGELGYKRFSYEFQNKHFGFNEITLREKQTLIELPVMVRYNIIDHYIFREERSVLNRFNPYLLAGGAGTYLLGSTATAFRKDDLGTERNFETNKQVSMTNMRKKWGYYAIAGIGFEYKKGRAILSLETRFHYGFADTVKPEKRYSNSDLIFSYGYVDNDMKFRNLSITVGYAYPIYRPKQKYAFHTKELSTQDLTPEEKDGE